MNTKAIKPFILFAIMVFVALMIGEWLSSFVVTTVGLGTDIIGATIAFVILIIPLYYILRKWGHKAGV